MTRDEAKEFGYGFVDNSDNIPNQYVLLVHEVDEVINKIYDDLESRVCSNCKYFIPIGWTDFGNKCISVENRVAYTSIDFGCNKFERKTD